MSSNLVLLKSVINREENKTCADCGARMPSMVCLNTSTFVCVSFSFDFSLMEVSALAAAGNDVAKRRYLATHDPRLLLEFMKEKDVPVVVDGVTVTAAPKKLGVVMADSFITKPSAPAFALPPPPSHSRPISSRAVVAPTHSVDDLLGIDFGADFTAAPVSTSIASEVTNNSVSNSERSVNESSKSSIKVDSVEPKSVPTIAAAAEPAPQTTTKSADITTPTRSSPPVSVNPFPNTPTSDDPFSFNEPIASTSATQSIQQQQQDLFMDSPPPETLSSEKPLDIHPLQFTAVTNANPTPVKKQDNLSDLLDLVKPETEVGQGSGMGSLLELALQGVQSTHEDVMGDLKSLALGGGLIDISEPAQQEVEKGNEVIEKREQKALREDQVLSGGWGVDEDEEEEEEVLAVPVSVSQPVAQFHTIDDVLDNPWG
ncbi:hypothetical protein BCR33DRAFT_713626 [Rhizoclosmatium globosum]|uniref:Uncharacterized protein n=1 Tax=Rhizoclosmatium globosum TaxID=329046 RepID=A0A1Y2CSN0_9FUNG|nr:hypothetical protein BCR33DRAFT_713626 [Rhizoclosmatium globosum]|eukprot:ORY50048.1 hypothetical protein BCR33DRAFT_713626 [Rhizoclosmatium globosum]